MKLNFKIFMSDFHVESQLKFKFRTILNSVFETYIFRQA